MFPPSRNENAPSPDDVEKGGKGKSKIKHQKGKISTTTNLISNFCFLIFLPYLAG